MAIAAGLEQTPELRLIQDSAPNAFAAGRNPKTAYVAVTTGIVQLMDERELEGVLAHEVSHIRNRDVRLMTLVAVLVGVIALLADVLLRLAFFGGGKRGSNPILTIVAFGALLIAPIAGVVIQLVGVAAPRVPRRRVGCRDHERRGGDGACAAQAPARPERDPQRQPRDGSHVHREPAEPGVRVARASFSGLFSTHPPLEKRIAALEEAGGFKLAPA